jgi:hypothetical protein
MTQRNRDAAAPRGATATPAPSSLLDASPRPIVRPPSRHPAGVVLAFFGLFIGGAAAGLGLARMLAPGSWWSEALSFLAFPFAFVIGIQAWFGAALFSVVLHVLRLLLTKGDRRAARVGPGIPGSFVFLPIGSVVGAVTGVAVGWLSGTYSAWLVAPIYWGAGSLYGFLTWRLARAGFLMPPESL